MKDGLVALTGGAGGVGARLVEALQRRGYLVRALEHRRPVPAADERLRGDLLDPAAVTELVAGAHGVVHAAAVTHARSSRGYGPVNVEGTRILLGAAAAAGVSRFVHVSTHAIDEVGGGGYSRSKAEAERLVAASGLETVVVRLPEVVGGGGREGVDRLLAAARAGRPLLVVGRGAHELRPVHVDDVAAAVAAAVDAPAAAGRVYTLGVPAVTFRELAERARDAYGGRSRILRVPESLVALVCRASQLLPLPVVPDQLDRLRAPRPPASPEAEVDLGFRPRPLRDVVVSDDPAA